MSVFLQLIEIIGIFVMIFVSPACMNMGLVRISRDDYKLTRKDVILCCIPVYNFYYGGKVYANRISISFIGSVSICIMVLIRMFNMFFYYNGNDMFQTVSIIALLCIIFLAWLCYAIDIFLILGDSGVYSITSRIFLSVTVIVGQIVIGYYMPRKMYYILSKEKRETIYDKE